MQIKIYVIPAEAGTQSAQGFTNTKGWVPAFAGMTGFNGYDKFFYRPRINNLSKSCSAN
jgi:hypothetical protein